MNTSGGRLVVYLSNILIRFDNHSKMKDDEGMGVSGELVNLTLVKSRANKAGRMATLVFDQDRGFDPILSMLQLLKDHKALGGAGRYLYVEGHDSIKFSQKEFKEKVLNTPELYTIVIEKCLEILQTYLFDSKQLDMLEKQYGMTQDILNKLN